MHAECAALQTVHNGIYSRVKKDKARGNTKMNLP